MYKYYANVLCLLGWSLIVYATESLIVHNWSHREHVPKKAGDQQFCVAQL